MTLRLTGQIERARRRQRPTQSAIPGAGGYSCAEAARLAGVSPTTMARRFIALGLHADGRVRGQRIDPDRVSHNPRSK